MMSSPSLSVSHGFASARWLRPAAAVAALLLAMLPFFGNAYHVTVAVNLCITLILTLSLNFVVGYSGQFQLSHVAFFGGGAYVSAIAATRLGWSPWLGLPCAVLVVGLLAGLIGLPSSRLKGLYLAVATLSFSLFVEVIVNQGGSITGGGYGIQDIPAAYLFGLKLSGRAFYAVAVVGVAMAYLVLRNILDSKLGREIVATRDHPDAAAASGINPAAIRLIALIIGAMLAAFAGWLHTFYHLSLNPGLLSPEWTFVWFFMVLVGGIGNNAGVILGTLLLTLVPEFLGFATGQTILGIGILMVLVTLFAPTGLGGLLDGLLRKAEAAP
jgi:branched-chain amino acid transport system permease protein